MESLTKQLRFFKVVLAILVVVLLAQFSFWLKQASNNRCAENNTVEKARNIHHHGQIIIPAVIHFLDYLKK